MAYNIEILRTYMEKNKNVDVPGIFIQKHFFFNTLNVTILKISR